MAKRKKVASRDREREPPRPSWDSGGPRVAASLALLDAPGFGADVASEIVTTASRLGAGILAQGGSIRDLMQATVRVASLAVQGARGDAERKKLPVVGAACSMGCSSCCYLHVSVTVPEALVIAAYLRDTRSDEELVALRAVVEATAARVRTLDQGRRMIEKIACPLLSPHDGSCTAYLVRPLVCAAANSLDAAACARALESGDAEATLPIDPLQRGGVRATRIGLSVALRARGLDAAHHELAGALAIALAHDDAETRYLAGESVFPGAGSEGDPAASTLCATWDAFIARDPHLSRVSALR